MSEQTVLDLVIEQVTMLNTAALDMNLSDDAIVLWAGKRAMIALLKDMNTSSRLFATDSNSGEAEVFGRKIIFDDQIFTYAIIVTLNGLPARYINAKTLHVNDVPGAQDELEQDIELLKALFSAGPMVDTPNPRVKFEGSNSRLITGEPVASAILDLNAMLAAGFVYRFATGAGGAGFALTRMGRQAINYQGDH